MAESPLSRLARPFRIVLPGGHFLDSSRGRVSAGLLLTTGVIAFLSAATTLEATVVEASLTGPPTVPAPAWSPQRVIPSLDMGSPAPTPTQQSRLDPDSRLSSAAQAGPGFWGTRLRALLGLVLLTGVAWIVGGGRRPVPWRVVAWGLVLQFGFALFVLRTPVGEGFFQGVDHVLHGVLDFSEEGARFIFGNLIYNNVPVGEGVAGTNDPVLTDGTTARTGAFFAFNVLSTIIFVSSLMAVLYHLGVMQRMVSAAAWVMQRTMGTSGAETLATAGNIFVGLMEAPLFIRPYIAGMTRSELMALLVGGFATVSGGTLAAYVGMLSPYFPGIAGHLIAASVMSAPAALVVAKLMLPETQVPSTSGALAMSVERTDVNVIDAAARGAAQGLLLAMSVAAMLLAFLALLHLLDALVGFVGGWVGFADLTLSGMLGWALRPVAWMVGVPWAESATVGQLIGVKTVLNEFVAFLQLADLASSEGALSPRSVTIASYALAGFANFGSIAMQIAGIGEIAPERRTDLAELGLKAMVGGALAALMTAAVAAILI